MLALLVSVFSPEAILTCLSGMRFCNTRDCSGYFLIAEGR